MTTDPGRQQALEGVRVLEVGTAIAGQLAAMLLADFGADVVKVEPPAGDPMRARPGFAMWNRGKRSVVQGDVDVDALVAAADIVVTGGGKPEHRLDAAEASAAHPGLVVLDLPPFLEETPWSGGEESAALLWAASGMALRQSSYEGGPVDPVAPYVLYLQGIWAAAAAAAALFERTESGFGQVVTVAGVHATMVAASATLVMDPAVPEVLANYGPGGPHPMYTRYQCADGVW
ncbi:MAG: CoA transferase, partial [Acidimicrobiales bacterium]